MDNRIETGLMIEIAALMNARRNLSSITKAILRDPLFFKRHDQSGENRYQATVLAQRLAWQGVMIELGYIKDSERMRKAQEMVLTALVRTQ